MNRAVYNSSRARRSIRGSARPGPPRRQLLSSSTLATVCLAALLMMFATRSGAIAQSPQAAPHPIAGDSIDAISTNQLEVDEDTSEPLDVDVRSWFEPDHIFPTIKVALLLGVVSLAPAILLMTTSFVRIVVVLGILRQALGFQQLPPTQVITALALFMSAVIMTPVWNEVRTEAIVPYSDPSTNIPWEEALQRGLKPVKRFMCRQIDLAGNNDDIRLFYQYLPDVDQQPAPKTYDDVPIQVLLPAFMISELKIAFFIGFQIYLPFLILDIVVSSVTISIGMVMVPPAMISLPLKLLLFVLVDGWSLMVGMLMESFAPYT